MRSFDAKLEKRIRESFGPVTVRHATPEDLARLAQARALKNVSRNPGGCLGE